MILKPSNPNTAKPQNPNTLESYALKREALKLYFLEYSAPNPTTNPQPHHRAGKAYATTPHNLKRKGRIPLGGVGPGSPGSTPLASQASQDFPCCSRPVLDGSAPSSPNPVASYLRSLAEPSSRANAAGVWRSPYVMRSLSPMLPNMKHAYVSGAR